jgi:hypothetical protein
MNDGGAGLTRTKELLNQAYLELCEEDKWPFLLTTNAAAVPPQSITDVREIRSVVYPGGGPAYKLWQKPLDDILEEYGEATTTGAPLWWYFENNTLRVYPVSTGTLTVRYWKVPVELVADADEPVIPNRFRRYIVEGMVRVAAAEDAPEAARAAEAERQLGLNLMRRSLLFDSGAPEFQRFELSLDS